MTRTAAHGGTISRLLGRLGGVAGSLVLGQVIVGLTYVLAARAISPAELGVVATCAAIGTIGATLFDAGLISLLVREVAGGTLSVQEARAVSCGKRRLIAVMFVPALVADMVITPSVAMGVILSFLGPAIWEAQTANGLLRAEGRFSRAVTGQLGGRLIGLGLVVLLSMTGWQEFALPTALVFAFATEAVVDRLFLGRAMAERRTLRATRGLHREGIGYGLTSLAASAQQLDTPLVALGAGLSEAGLYAAAGRLLGPLNFLATSLGMVAAPWLAEARADGAKLRAEENRVIRVGACLCLAPLLAAAVGPVLLPLVLGAQYRASGAVFAILALGSVLSSANQPLAIIAQNRGAQQNVALAVCVGLGLGLVATYGLALAGGATWAAAALLVSQLYILVHLGLTVRRLRSGRRS